MQSQLANSSTHQTSPKKVQSTSRNNRPSTEPNNLTPGGVGFDYEAAFKTLKKAAARMHPHTLESKGGVVDADARDMITAEQRADLRREKPADSAAPVPVTPRAASAKPRAAISRAMIGKPLTDFAPVGVRPARMQGFNLIVGNTRVTGSHQLRRSTSGAAVAEVAGGLGVGKVGAGAVVTPVGGTGSEFATAKTGINARAMTTTASTGRAK